MVFTLFLDPLNWAELDFSIHIGKEIIVITFFQLLYSAHNYLNPRPPLHIEFNLGYGITFTRRAVGLLTLFITSIPQRLILKISFLVKGILNH